MAKLTVRKDNGEILFDTDKITYGLVKSGNMQLIQSWSRQTLKSVHLDPTNGANWNRSTIVAPPAGDVLWGFTVDNARSPIVFIHGPGCLDGTIKSGNSLTFLYSGASTSTQFYCFDLMSNNMIGGPYLKTYRESDGVLTFNSLQPPLNIVHSATPTPPSPPPSGSTSVVPYSGAGVRVFSRQKGGMVGGVLLEDQTDCALDIEISAGIKYATYLPWSRGCGIWDSLFSHDSAYGCVEGAYGRVGGISFMFGAAAGTTRTYAPAGPGSAGGWRDVPTDRYPIALSIDATNLPFPFN